MKLKRDHGYTQQKRLKHEREINKYTGNLQGKNTTTNFVTNVIYCISKKLQINLILKVSSPQRESLRQDNQTFWKVLKVGCVHGLCSAAFTSCPRNPCYVQSFSFFIFSVLLFEAQILSCTRIILQSSHPSDKNGYRKFGYSRKFGYRKSGYRKFGYSRRLAPVIKCRRFLSFFQRYIVRDISLARFNFESDFEYSILSLIQLIAQN